MNTHRPLLVLIAALLIPIAGCRSSSLIGNAPSTAATVAPQGIRYYAGKDVVVLKVDVTETKTVKLDKSFNKQTSTTTKREGTATLNTIADTTQPFVVDMLPGGRFDNTLVVETRPNGLLKSINAQSTGKTGEAVVSLAKFVGTIAGLPQTVGLGGAGTECSQTPDPVLAALPINPRATIESDAAACVLFREIVALEKERARFEEERLRLERDAAGATAAQLTLNTKRIATIAAAIVNLNARHAEKQAALVERIDRFIKTNELGSTSTTVSYSDMLDLAQLPSHTTVTDGMLPAAVETALQSHAAALEVFKRTGAVATADALPEWAKTPARGLPASEKERARIFFRQGQPLRLKFLVRSNCGGQTECMKTLSDQVLDVLHSGAGVQFLEFDESAFAQRKLVLSFDEKGRPEKLERSGTSDLAALTSTLSNAATTLRDEFAATLTKVEAIQTSQRNIELDDLTSELNRLKKEKEILDARLAVEGTSLNFGNSLEQSRLNAELAALQADIALQSARATAEQSIEIARLKAATALLVEEVNLIKAQIAAEQARR